MGKNGLNLHQPRPRQHIRRGGFGHTDHRHRYAEPPTPAPTRATIEFSEAPKVSLFALPANTPGYERIHREASRLRRGEVVEKLKRLTKQRLNQCRAFFTSSDGLVFLVAATKYGITVPKELARLAIIPTA